MRRLFPGAVLLLLSTSTVAHAQQMRKAPALGVTTIRGGIVRLSDYKGRVVLLNSWATWCPPCRAEMPDLVKMQREYAKRGLQVFGVTYPPETASRVRRFVRS